MNTCFSKLCFESKLQLTSYLSLLIDDWHCILQLDIVKQTGQENIGHTDQTVILLLIEERVRTFEVRPHYLKTERVKNGVINDVDTVIVAYFFSLTELSSSKSFHSW